MEYTRNCFFQVVARAVLNGIKIPVLFADTAVKYRFFLLEWYRQQPTLIERVSRAARLAK